MDGQPVQYLKALDVWGVAPVTRGAGKGTRTTMIKSQEGKEQSEGEVENDKPSESVLSPSVIQVQIDLIKLELEN